MKYDYIYDLGDDGTRAVRKDGKFGLIDKNGKIILECKYWGMWVLKSCKTRRVYIDKNNWFEFNYKKLKVLNKFIEGKHCDK